MNEIYELDLHEGTWIKEEEDNFTWILRVPGGWIYMFPKCNPSSRVFVPFNNEFVKISEDVEVVEQPITKHGGIIMEIKGYKLIQTCSVCPEQYNVFKNDKQVGYLRLRHGIFTVAYPDCGYPIIYSATPEGDGNFEEHERDRYLNEAIDAIAAADANNGSASPSEIADLIDAACFPEPGQFISPRKEWLKEWCQQLRALRLEIQ